ncbi:MAG: DNA-binding protein [Fusobacteria bacterium]|nr:MAG: DNA-binding protein [Fusobacteriota bacterium]KAF0228645.1 MAG: DNA-binding [Fusobacteriota bacterium]
MDIGSRLRRVRVAKHMRLKDVAEAADISISFLSQIENNKVNASISTLQTLANTLDIQVADLFMQHETSDIKIIRKEQRRNYKGTDGITESILSLREGSALETTIIEFPPKSKIKIKAKHEGEEFTFVISGSINVWLDNQVFKLNEGDIIYYISLLEHTWENTENERAVVLVTNTPVSF